MRRSALRRALAALVLLLALVVAPRTAAAFFFARRPSAPKNTSPAWPTLGLVVEGGDGAFLEQDERHQQQQQQRAAAATSLGGDDEAPPPLPGALESDERAAAATAAVDPADAVRKFEAAVRRLLPPTPTMEGNSGRSAAAARSLLATKRPPAATAVAAVGDYTILDYAYFVATITPRRNGTAGVCPTGGARGAEGQKLAAVLMRSLRLESAYANITLKPLQCWSKPGVWDQVFNNDAAPWQAYWVFVAENMASSKNLGNEFLFGDHTFGDASGIPRNSSCYAGPIRKSDGMFPLGQGKIPTALRSWCSVQNRAGRQALGLHLAYVTHAKKGVASCEDGMWNGAESGKDCGAPCKNAKCKVGEGCSDAKDCPTGIGCDPAQIYPPKFEDDGTVALGGLGTCALSCLGWTSTTGCPAGTIPDARYASDFCAADKTTPCTGKTYAEDPADANSCCSTTAPCSSITTCNAVTQYPEPDPNVRCSNTACNGAGDNAKCCLNRAPCSSAFSSSGCLSLDANSIYNSAGYCAGSTCSTTTDKATCCPPRALCSSTFTAAVCKANDPNAGTDAGLVYTVTGTARCAGTACNTSGAGVDWGTCCNVVASCADGFFGTGKTCPAGYGKVTTGSPNCAGRTCSSSDFATCCFKFTARTCQVWANAVPSGSTVCTSGDGSTSYGGLIANPGSTSCVSDTQCFVLCCTSVGTIQTCDTLRQTTPTYCGATATSFLSPPLYPSCSLGVSGSCDEACCKKT